ncbi:unnamed protein product, partial [marine sediment metagenome]
DLTKEERSSDRLSIGGTIQATSGAGNQNRPFLVNPVNSGNIVVVERLFCYNATADATTDSVQIELSTGDGVGNMLFRDRRLTGKPVVQAGASTSATAVLAVPWFFVPSDGLFLNLDIILGEGDLIFARQGTANQVWTCTWFWRERDRLAGE